MPQPNNEYPPIPNPNTRFAAPTSLDPDYMDEAAVELYKVCGGSKLVGALARLHAALQSQSAKLEEYHNSPYSEDNARLVSVTVNAIREIELQVERWHHLIYPNQKGR